MNGHKARVRIVALEQLTLWLAPLRLEASLVNPIPQILPMLGSIVPITVDQTVKKQSQCFVGGPSLYLPNVHGDVRVFHPVVEAREHTIACGINVIPMR